MPKITYSQAREMLSQACSRYINHKKSQLNDFIGHSPYSVDSSLTFFLQAVGKAKPSPGFNDWARCWYYSTLETMFYISTKHYMSSYIDNTPCILPIDLEIKPGYYYDDHKIPFKQIKSYQPEDELLDQHEPQLVLYNLEVLIDVLNEIMRDDLSDRASLKEHFGYRERDYMYTDASPFSLKIDLKLNQLDALATLIKSLPGYHSKYAVSALSHIVQQGRDHFSVYLKEIAVAELKDTLDDDSLTDADALSKVELQLKDHSTLAILEKDNQSEAEQRLKLLSVLMILVGIGIFTTLGLAAKRLYDSGGSSVNFFKPLSINLCEDIKSITESTKPSM